jgi:hypothetical protein
MTMYTVYVRVVCGVCDVVVFMATTACSPVNTAFLTW